MKQLTYSSIKNLPKIQIKGKAFEKESIENFINNISKYSSFLQNSFYFKNPIKKLTYEEYFNLLLFKYNNIINKGDFFFFLKKKNLFYYRKTKRKNYYKITQFYSIKNISCSSKRKIYSILQSPHVFKKSQEHFEYKINKSLNIISCLNSLEKDRFFLCFKNIIFKKYFGLQIQYKIVSSDYYFR